MIILLTSIGCGKKSSTGDGTNSYASSIRMGALLSATSSSLNADSNRDSISSNLNINQATLDHTTWAHVLGVKLKVVSIDIDGDNSHSSIVDYTNDGGKSIEITKDSYSDSLHDAGFISEGTYKHIKVRFKNQFDVKAYGYTLSGTCYTTSTHVECNPNYLTEEEITALPDFGYKHYTFMYVTTSHSPNDQNNDVTEVTEFLNPITIDAMNPNPSFQIRIDMYRLFTLWDGVGNSGTLSPFTWGNNHGHDTSEFFPPNQAHFGLSYIPTYVSINDNGNAIGEVYLVSPNAGDLLSYDDNAYDLNGIQYLTVTYKSSGEFVGARVVNFSQDSNRLMQFIHHYQQQGNGSFEFLNGEWYQDQQRYLQDRKVMNFERTNLNVIQNAILTDSTDCGTHLIDSRNPLWGERTRDCINGNLNLSFMRIR